MWTKSYSLITKAVTKEQLWKLFSEVDKWPTWDDGLESAELVGPFEKGSHIILKIKGGPKVKVKLLETVVNRGFLDVTTFPLAKMYDRHSFEETPDGLKVTTTLYVKGFLSFVWIKLVAQKLADALPLEMKKQIERAGQL